MQATLAQLTGWVRATELVRLNSDRVEIESVFGLGTFGLCKSLNQVEWFNYGLENKDLRSKSKDQSNSDQRTRQATASVALLLVNFTVKPRD